MPLEISKDEFVRAAFLALHNSVPFGCNVAGAARFVGRIPEQLEGLIQLVVFFLKVTA